MGIVVISTIISTCLIIIISVFIYRPVKKRQCLGDYKWFQEKKF